MGDSGFRRTQAPTDRPVLTLRNVSVSFRVGGIDVPATRDVSLSVYPGEDLGHRGGVRVRQERECDVSSGSTSPDSDAPGRHRG